MAQGVWALLFNGQAVESRTLGNPKQEKSRSGGLLKKNCWDFYHLNTGIVGYSEPHCIKLMSPI